MLQLTYELRPKWNKNNNNKNKSQNAVSRSDPLQGSDKKTFVISGTKYEPFCMCGNICRSTGLVPTWCRYTFTMCSTILFSDLHCDICRSTNVAQCSAVTRLSYSWKKRKKKHRQKLTQRNSTEAMIRHFPQNSVKYHYKAYLTPP